MKVDLSLSDALPDYGKLNYLRNSFNEQIGIEVITVHAKVIFDQRALEQWKIHVNNWYAMHKGNKSVELPNIKMWVINHPGVGARIVAEY